MFELEALQARHGDSLLLHYGTKTKPRLIVIDGGPSSVYAKSLRPALAALKTERGGALDIRLLMVSHLDDDHIGGLIRLVRELVQQREELREESWNIETIWNNAFDDLVQNQPALGGATAAAAAASIASSLPQGLEWSEAVFASVGQGRTFRDTANGLAKVNSPFKDLVKSRKKAISMGGGLSFIVVAPSEERLAELQDAWNKEIEKLRKKGKLDAESAAYLDKSAYNLSSIVVLAKSKGKTMLLTGDARGDYILESLEDVGLLKKKKSMKVDVLKMPHHGSHHNVDKDFFERIIADHYVFSGDGNHDNPEPDCVEMLINARGDDEYTMHFTYAVDDFVAKYPQAKARKLKKLLATPGKNFKVVTAPLGGSVRVVP